MNHDHRIKAFFACALTFAAASASATADGPDFFVVRDVSADSALNIRATPSMTTRKVGSIAPNATCIRNLGCRGGLTLQEFTTLSPEQQQQRQRDNPRWCRIEYQGVSGWAAGHYLGEGACTR